MHFLRIVAAVAVAYGCYAAFCFVVQRLVIYPGRGIRASAASPGQSAGVVQTWLTTGFGKTEAWFLPGKGITFPARRPAVLFFHGNGEVIDFLPPQVEGFRAMGMAVLLVEYPGYGRSEGTPSEASIVATGVAAYDTLVKRPDVDPARVIAFGRSIGSGPACALSRQRPLAALILQSPFTSIRSFARHFLLPGFLLRDVYDNRAALAAFPGPVLILHGRFDDVIPFSQGEELSRVAPHVRFVELTCAHNDCPPDWQEFWRLIGDFLRGQRIIG
jgi:fermentation-respiration switch protein FrsA (DUF1100 family)